MDKWAAQEAQNFEEGTSEGSFHSYVMEVCDSILQATKGRSYNPRAKS